MDQIEVNEKIPETTLRDYLRVLFRHEFIILLCIFTVCATVFVGLELKTKVYESSVKMLITAEKQVESIYYKDIYQGGNIQQSLTQSEIVRSNAVLNRVVQSLALDKRPVDDEKQFASAIKAWWIEYKLNNFQSKINKLPLSQQEDLRFRQAVDSLKKNITVTPIRDTNMFTINVTDYNPVGAAVIANVISRSYIIFDLEQQLAELNQKYGEKHPKVEIIKDSIAAISKTLNGAPIDAIDAIGPASVKIIEQASVALEPIGASKILTLLLAGLMSIFLGVILAFIFEYADQTIKSPSEIEQILNLPVLGSILKKGLFSRALINTSRSTSKKFQSYQAVSEQIHLLTKNKDVHSLLITSALGREGSHWVTANIGFYLACQLQQKVLIIDADFRKSSASKSFKLGKALGLASFIENEAPIEKIIKSINEGLDVIPAGRTKKNPLALLESDKMKNLILDAKEEYDIVLMNCASLRTSKDAVVLGGFTDGVVINISESKVRRQVLQNSYEQLKENNVNVIGCIFNNRTYSIPKFFYDRF